MTEEEMLAGVCMDDLPDQTLADMAAAHAKIPVSVKDQGSYNLPLADVLADATGKSQSAIAGHVATEDPHPQYVRGTEIGETLCPLEGGVIPSRYFPASYDEVQYYDTLDDFPSSGVDNVIYVSRADGFTWRWGGEAYHRLNASLALGETADTAYPGNKGKVAYDHALAEGNPHRTTPADIGLGNVDNTSDADKPVSTATGAAIASASTADRNRANHTGTQAASTISDFVSTVRSTVLTGLATGTNVAIAATDTVLGGLAKLQAQITASLSTLNSHTGRTDNPHSVTKAQVGLGSVDNTSDADKPVSTATSNAISTASTADRNRANHTGTQAASTISDFASTVRSTVLTGLATGTNVAIAATDTVLGGLAKLQAQITASLSTLNSHTGRTDNPHSVTKAQVGLGSVDNTSDADKPVSTATSNAISTASTADRNRSNHTGTQAASTISDFASTVRSTVLTGLASGTNAAIAATDTLLGGLAKLQAQIAASLSILNNHTGRTDNPHSVTKAQVGLGNVDNTSDLDKPVSTATSNAISTASTADRNRANHTGTQAASTISDFANTVRATVLTGLSTATNAAIAATDSALVAFGKLQAQITANLTNGAVTKLGTSNVGDANTPIFLSAGSPSPCTALDLPTSGNAATASRTLIGTCATTQATVAKYVALSAFSLATGATIQVVFTYAAVAAATLNVNGTGAKPIYAGGSAATTSTWSAGDIVTFQYDGTYWQVLYLNADSSTTAMTLYGNATSAAKLATARTISLTGDVSGAANFDGSGNMSIAATVTDDSHNHIMANVDGLDAALASKAAAVHAHAFLTGSGPNTGRNIDTLMAGINQFAAYVVKNPVSTAGLPSISTAAPWVYVTEQVHTDTAYALQTVTDYWTDKTWRRRKETGDWKPWAEMLTGERETVRWSASVESIATPAWVHDCGRAAEVRAGNVISATKWHRFFYRRMTATSDSATVNMDNCANGQLLTFTGTFIGKLYISFTSSKTLYYTGNGSDAPGITSTSFLLESGRTIQLVIDGNYIYVVSY